MTAGRIVVLCAHKAKRGAELPVRQASRPTSFAGRNAHRCRANAVAGPERPVNARLKFSMLRLPGSPQGAAVGLVLAAVLAGCSSGPAPLVQPGGDGTVIVRPGDSLYKIARRHRVSLRALIDVNRAAPPYVIHPGQKLRLPPKGVSRAAPAAAPRRGGKSSATGTGRAGAGQRPADAKRREAGAAAKGAPADARSPKAEARRAGATGRTRRTAATAPPARGAKEAGRTAAPAPRAKPGPPPSGSGRARFIWPLKGTVISRYGPIGKGLYNDGINIAAPLGTAVRAAGGGVVAYAGNEIRGFGNLILIRHPNGWVSAYAHNGKMLVEQGQKVRQGQVVSRVGASGNVNRPQLHFELRRRNRAVDPERHLGGPIASRPEPERVIQAWFRSARQGTGRTAMRRVPSGRPG